jgi:DNA-binding transcriptional ArsR family regulator
MTVRVRFPADIGERVRFAMSPLLEGLWGLHTWREPDHHPLNHIWIRSIDSLPSPLRRDLARYAFMYKGRPDAIGLPLDGDRPLIKRELARLREATDSEALRFLVRGHYRGEPPADGAIEPEIAAQFLADAARSRASRELAERALREPRETLLAFADVFERFWDTIFASTWERSLPRRRQEVHDARSRIADGGITDLLAGMWPEVRLGRDRQEFTIRRGHEHDIELGPDDHLTLVVSFCVWPHVHVYCDRPGGVILAFSPSSLLAKFTPTSPPTDLLGMLEALADDTRLRTLRFLRGHPRSTQELSGLVGVSAPTLSEHLHRLEAAGVLRSWRKGHYVLYELAVDLGELVNIKIDDYLGPPESSADTGEDRS